mmetsp:Transcript_35057/g.88363  ORF Transcript_35057/g.88363 Transcript_35057/m.88363 type:complete len:311 (-) Transcript_35057:63-995(-)
MRYAVVSRNPRYNLRTPGATSRAACLRMRSAPPRKTISQSSGTCAMRALKQSSSKSDVNWQSSSTMRNQLLPSSGKFSTTSFQICMWESAQPTPPAVRSTPKSFISSGRKYRDKAFGLTSPPSASMWMSTSWPSTADQRRTGSRNRANCDCMKAHRSGRRSRLTQYTPRKQPHGSCRRSCSNLSIGTACAAPAPAPAAGNGAPATRREDGILRLLPTMSALRPPPAPERAKALAAVRAARCGTAPATARAPAATAAAAATCPLKQWVGGGRSGNPRQAGAAPRSPTLLLPVSAAVTAAAAAPWRAAAAMQ